MDEIAFIFYTFVLWNLLLFKEGYGKGQIILSRLQVLNGKSVIKAALSNKKARRKQPLWIAIPSNMSNSCLSLS